MSFFDFAVKKQSINIETKEDKKKSPFDYVFKIFDIINKTDKNHKDKLDLLFKETNDNEFGFLSWAINHYIVYNKHIREFMEFFFNSLAFLGEKEYIYFFVKYCVESNIKFPKYMYWYKSDINNAPKRYKEKLKEFSKLKDEDLQEFIDYMSLKGISLRETVVNLEAVDF